MTRTKSVKGLLPETVPDQQFRVFLADRSKIKSPRLPAREVDRIIHALQRTKQLWRWLAVVLPDPQLGEVDGPTMVQRQVADLRHLGLILTVRENQAKPIAHALNSLGGDWRLFCEIFHHLDQPWPTENDCLMFAEGTQLIPEKLWERFH